MQRASCHCLYRVWTVLQLQAALHTAIKRKPPSVTPSSRLCQQHGEEAVKMQDAGHEQAGATAARIGSDVRVKRRTTGT